MKINVAMETPMPAHTWRALALGRNIPTAITPANVPPSSPIILRVKFHRNWISIPAMARAETVPKEPARKVIRRARRSQRVSLVVLFLSLDAGFHQSVTTVVAMECMLESRLDIEAAKRPAMTRPARPAGI